MHQYYGSDRFVTNSYAFDIWVDIPKSTPQKDGWIDAKRISPRKQNSVTRKKSQNKPNSKQELSPRTSTPVMNENLDKVKCNKVPKDAYESWKDHLHETPKNLKVRGASIKNESETIISGHIDMKNLEPFSYTYEQHFMPDLNNCFVNLLINGVSSLNCHEHRNPGLPNQANCNCIPVCNCRAKLALNMNFPAYYKYNENGFVVPTVPSVDQLPYHKNPNCIYTT